METPLDNSIKLLLDEQKHLAALNECFIYFAALAETRHRGYPSDLFECLGTDLPRVCDSETAARIHSAITQFIEECPNHPNVGSAFRILFNLGVENDLKEYFVSKLKFYYGQGDAQTVYQLCVVMEDLGLDVFRDERGAFIQSRGSPEGEKNLGVARRFLERHEAEQRGTSSCS
jgi:hypothetical protein